MLTLLKIESLGLVDKKEFSFNSGFTALTGETGSGKTSLLEALLLTLGKKSNFDFIKSGSSKAVCESHFELPSHHPLFAFLKEHQVPLEMGETLMLRRELSKEGKTKAFINQTPVAIHLLQKCAPYLISYMDQESLFQFKDPLYFLDFIDATLPDPLALFHYQESYKAYQSLVDELKKLESRAENKDFLIETLSLEIDELSAANVLPDEETALFNRYKQAQTFLDQGASLSQNLEKLNSDLLPKLKRLKMEKNLELHDEERIETAYHLLCDVSLDWEKKIDSMALEPEAIEKMELRLSLLHKLKKKYQSGTEDLSTILSIKKTELEALLALEERLSLLNKEKTDLENKTLKLATLLSEKRKEHAKQESQKLAQVLKPLNFPFIELAFKFETIALNSCGIDRVDLWMKAHADTPLSPASEAASGGELARLNFALFLSRADKLDALTYVFDEIDSSVGGITSSLMGDKLKILSENRQVLCITHFPQMALKADHHWVFEKKQTHAKTEVYFQYSEAGPLESEIKRMQGQETQTNLALL